MNRRTTTAFAGGSMLLDRGLRDQLRLGWRLLRDERVSAFKFAIPALLALYLASPVDVIPDFLLGIAQVDDMGIVIAGVLLVAKIIPRLAPGQVVDEHLREMGTSGPGTKTRERAQNIFDAQFDIRG